MEYLNGIIAIGIAIILSLFLQSVKKVLKNYLQNGKNREDRQSGKD